MQSARILVNAHCAHKEMAKPSGLALVTIGNSSSREDGIASRLCNMLPEAALKGVCRFNLGSYTGFLSDCLSGHKAAIIIDTTKNNTAPGTVSIMNLSAMLDRATIMNIKSSHGFFLADELRIAKQYGTLPHRLIFFGVEVDAADCTKTVSTANLPQMVRNLSLLVTTVLETLRRDA